MREMTLFNLLSCLSSLIVSDTLRLLIDINTETISVEAADNGDTLRERGLQHFVYQPSLLRPDFAQLG